MTIPRSFKAGVRASVELNALIPSISHSNDSPSWLVKFSTDSRLRSTKSQKR